MTEILVTHPDPDAYAAAYNHGYRDAMIHADPEWAGELVEPDEPPHPTTVTEWAVEYPAGVRTVTEDEAEAADDCAWTYGGSLVHRFVTRTEWTSDGADA